MKDYSLDFKGHNFILDQLEVTDIKNMRYCCKNCQSILVVDNFKRDYCFWPPNCRGVQSGKYFDLLLTELSCNQCIIKNIIE